jgi:hypothetical protein
VLVEVQTPGAAGGVMSHYVAPQHAMEGRPSSQSALQGTVLRAVSEAIHPAPAEMLSPLQPYPSTSAGVAPNLFFCVVRTPAIEALIAKFPPVVGTRSPTPLVGAREVPDHIGIFVASAFQPDENAAHRWKVSSRSQYPRSVQGVWLQNPHVLPQVRAAAQGSLAAPPRVDRDLVPVHHPPPHGPPRLQQLDPRAAVHKAVRRGRGGRGGPRGRGQGGRGRGGGGRGAPAAEEPDAGQAAPGPQ